MSRFETWLNVDLKKPNNVTALKGRLFTQDAMSNLVGVNVFDNDTPVDSLSGSVIGWVMRADGNTLVINGEKDGNKAYIVLPEAAYAVVGNITIAIQLVDESGENEVKTTLGVCTGYVYRTTTDTIIDPGEVVPDLTTLLAKIEEMSEATEAANDAAETATNLGKTTKSKLLNAYLVDVCGDEYSQSAYKSVDITKNQNTIILNGTASGSCRAKISGDIDIVTSLPEAWRSESLGLIQGKKYRMSVAIVSGSMTAGTLYVSTMDNTGGTTVNYVIKATDNIPAGSVVYSEDFTASSGNQSCVYFYFASGAAFSNYTFQLNFVCIDDIREDLLINFDRKLYGEETDNLLSFSKNACDYFASYGYQLNLINSNEVNFTISKNAGLTLRIPLASNLIDVPFNYDKFRPNLPAGTYTLFYSITNPAPEYSSIRIRRRSGASENGTNIAHGVPFTIDAPAEVHVAITSGEGVAEYNNTTLKFAIYAGEVSESRYIPRFTAVDSKARAMLEELAFANSDEIETDAKIIINKLRQPGDMLITVGSDYHFHNSQEEREGLWKYVAFCRSIAIDNMVELGDNVKGYDEDTPDKTRKDMAVLNNTLRNAMHPILYVVGNHDDASGYVKTHSEDADDFIQDNELRNYYVLTSDPGIVKTDSLYYYTDKEESKIRVIVLNSSDIPKENDSTTGKAKYYTQDVYAFRNAQINWLKDVLLETPEGYSIVVLVHTPLSRDYINFSAVKELIISCHTASAYTNSDDTPDFEYSVTADFRTHQRKVLCVLCGHTHDPKVEDLVTGEEYSGSSIVASGIPQIIQDNGETYQNAYIINSNNITLVSLATAEKTEIDISET